MIHIFTALYPEAKPLIQALSLKKRAAQTHYQQFLSEEGDLCLTITGVGPLQAAAVTASVLTDFDAGASDQLLSLGTAAALTACPASMYHVNKITEAVTMRDFYPDMLLNTGLPEASLITGAKLYTKQESGYAADLYDMEAAAVYQAASMFLGPHQMNFLRIVTDDGLTQEEMETGMTVRTVTNAASGTESKPAVGTEASAPRSLAAHVTACVEQQVDTIVTVVDKLRALTAAEAAGHQVLTENEQQLVDKLIADAHFSKVMADECVQLIRYAALSELDWQQPIAALYAEGLVPTRDKRAGKIILERHLRARILDDRCKSDTSAGMKS
jgi:nucleoside phosphorylase